MVTMVNGAPVWTGGTQTLVVLGDMIGEMGSTRAI